ncbi:hypothetical protein [Sulfurimonas sp.]|uniref:hypothetical protein n=1 Tax=Sulfurimonas sp. TaxID=2022749 RepID=UPI0025FE6DDA|nr:hypothetical protein [Sulfurimonas sp.]
MIESQFLFFYESTEAYIFDNFKENILFYSIALAALIGKMKESSKKNMLSAWIMYFMGTFFHELSHFIISFFTIGKPFRFSVIPSSTVDKLTGQKMITLGHVKSRNVKWWNVFLISMSPLLLFPLSFWVYSNFFNYLELNLWTVIIYVFSIVSLLFSAIPSGVDFKNVFTISTPINLIVPSILFMLYLFLDHNNILYIGGLF